MTAAASRKPREGDRSTVSGCTGAHDDVGDLATLQGPLLSLGWRPIEVRDERGRVLRSIAPTSAAQAPPAPSDFTSTTSYMSFPSFWMGW